MVIMRKYTLTWKQVSEIIVLTWKVMHDWKENTILPNTCYKYNAHQQVNKHDSMNAEYQEM